jgi:cell division septation protein DedD
MENFEPRPKGVREKNLYVVHLDTPRIIILSSIVIGIITASFLLGMSLMKDDKSSQRNLSLNDFNLDEKSGIDLFSKDVPPLPGFNISDDVKESGGFSVSGLPDMSPGITDGSSSAGETGTGTSLTADVNRGKADVLTGDNIKEIIPPAKKAVKPVPKTVKQARVETKPKEQPAKQIAKKNENRKPSEKRIDSGKSRVQEVSRDMETRKATGGFAVQVASYDVLARAEQERNVLKSKRFDSYVDRTVVNGKNYFRVRIGPVASKDKAFQLLEEIQGDSRYAGSYLVKE